MSFHTGRHQNDEAKQWEGERKGATELLAAIQRVGVLSLCISYVIHRTGLAPSFKEID